MTSRILEQRGSQSEELFKALASDTRLKIIDLLAEREMNINELRQALGIAPPSVSKHVQILEQAGLVTSEYMSGEQGTQKRCKLRYDRLIISLDSMEVPDGQIEESEMPIGMYTFAHPTSTCGIASREKMIGFYDEPQSFLLPERAQAQILWMAEGFVEYVFPNTVPSTMEIQRVDLTMEICSECPDYNNDYPSDITLWINGVEIGDWTSPGDLGGKRGRLNPAWWNDHDTQHGLLKVWSVDNQGSSVDGMAVSDKSIKELMIGLRQPVTVRIGIKPDAEHVGGFNLFGRGFGNYEQDLTLRLHYKPKEALKEKKAIKEEESPAKQSGDVK
ncbi:transcriptional regulator [Capsulimonas corticalis]|uniref:Transcriptional regulator n=1 Tax=Capsulimonas corticalis TaxID=2219043 RepID=A0A402CYW2_9BACT|nr:metalloregulator ArsR/SmtB family transcription factor [Capsulimonas corticalis]BDI29628.1 transcriptional regulator [Capsulimonas corticalis]